MNAAIIAMTEMITCWSSSRSTPFEKLDFICQILWVFYVGIGWKRFHDVFDIMQRGLNYIVFVEFLKCLSGRQILVNLFGQVAKEIAYLAVPDCKINIFVE